MNDTRDGILDLSPYDLWLGEPPSAIATTAANALSRADIYTVRDLVSRSAGDLLLDVRGFGPASLAEVQRVLARHGLALAGDPS